MQTRAYTTRAYAGTEDLAGMVAVINAVRDRDGLDDVRTVAEMAQQYEHLQRCDPATDIVIVEEAGTIVGYSRTMWEDVSEGYRIYWLVVEAHPQHPGIEEDLYQWGEGRARAVAATHAVADKRLSAEADESGARAALLRRRGYLVRSYDATLVRSHLNEIPDRRLPEGVETRGVDEAHLRQIWEAEVEAFRDHRGYTEQTETDWEAWLDSPNWDPSLWQIAWTRDHVVGQVRSFIDPVENEKFGRLRGWTEDISTAREWRGRGVAGALICSSLQLLAERGMTEAALGVDTENPTGALRLYESLGFVRTRLFGVYEKPL
ncbi:MAG: GNAT family N-acetyltransferase [Acidimicrobiia bacterium]